MGTVPLGEEETTRLIKGGVQVFLRAYAPAPSATLVSVASAPSAA